MNLNHGNEQGLISLLMLVLMMLLLVVAFGIVALTDQAYNNSEIYGRQLDAQNLAEAGVEKVLWQLAQNPAWRSYTSEQDISLGDGTYYIAELRQVNGNVTAIRSQGWVPNRTDPNAIKAEVVVEVNYSGASYFSNALFGSQSVQLWGGTTMDGYNSAVAAYASYSPKDDTATIGTNNAAVSAIEGSGTFVIHGAVYYPKNSSASNVTFWGSSTITKGILSNPGSTTLNPIPAVPANAVYLKPLTNVSGTVHYYTLSGTDLGTVLSPGTYVLTSDSNGNSIQFNGSGNMYMSGSDMTYIYFQGNVQFNGSSIINQGNRPSNLVLYGMSGCTQIQGNGTQDFYGGIYAPQAYIQLNGGAQYYGAIVGNSIQVSSTLYLHYDESMMNISGPSGGKYSITTWSQTS